MFCSKCGSQLPENSGFCPKCGATQINEETGVTPTVAAPVSVGTVIPAQTVGANKKGKNKFVVPAIIITFIICCVIVSAINDVSSPATSTGGGNKPPQPKADATAKAASSGDRIVIGETQIYNDDDLGNMEVTLDYAEFIDRIENPLLGNYTFPDEGSIFLRAVFTLRNIGTSSALVLTAWNTVVYDGVYEFRLHSLDGNFDIGALMPPETASNTFMVPNSVAESDGSLVLNFGDGSGKAAMSFVIR